MEDHNLYQSEIKIETADDYEKQSELNDMRQHANKIIHGIKKLDNNDANRAIWELFQNAIDLSDKCKINIKRTESTFEFSHNGEPFTPMTLDCLFKQVSSKTLEEKKQNYDEKDPIGQYGTGFMTTHTFGKELTIEGALIKGEGYVRLSEFVINRFTDNWKELASRIRDLKIEVSSLLKVNEIRSPPYPNTTFTYKTVTKHDQECAEKAISSLKLILPYVMVLNPKLESVIINDLNKEEILYKKNKVFTQGNLQIMQIVINEDEKAVCYLQSENNKIIIILPLTSAYEAFDFDENIPRLFLQYPLIGTQNFGINYIINSRYFQPTEPRTGIYLKSDNDSNEKDEVDNRQLIDEASELVFKFVQSNASQIVKPIKLATINFNVNSDDALLNDYYTGLKSIWIDKFKDYPIVETGVGNLKPVESVFLHDELLLNETNFDAIFTLTNHFWKNTPKKYLTKEWTKKTNEWNVKEVKYVTLKDIVLKIEETTNLGVIADTESLKSFYTYLIDQGKSHFFNDFKILPNIKGEFRYLSGNEGLNSSLNLTEEMVEIANVIMPDIPKRHVHPDFKFSLEFTDYTRKNFSADINEYLTKLVSEKATSKTLQNNFLQKLILYCSIATTADSTSRMVKLISNFYYVNEKLILIPLIKDDELDLRSPQRKLVRLFLNDISTLESQAVVGNIGFLKDVISTGANYEAYKEMFQTIAVFPNQLYELKEQNFLSIDDNIPADIKNLYDTVIKSNYPVRATLVHPDFQEYIKNKPKKSVRDLTEKIENKFFDEQLHFSIKDHPFKKQILDIIEKIKIEKIYEKYYPLIYSRRS